MTKKEWKEDWKVFGSLYMFNIGLAIICFLILGMAAWDVHKTHDDIRERHGWVKND